MERTSLKLGAWVVAALLAAAPAAAQPKKPGGDAKVTTSESGAKASNGPTITRIKLKGTPSEEQPQTVAPAKEKAPTELEKVERELEALRGRVAELELKMVETQHTMAQLRSANEKLQALTDDLVQAREQALAREEQRQKTAADLTASLVTMQQIQAQMMTGSTNVDAQLAKLQARLEGEPANAIAATRDRLKNGDLANARASLDRAMQLAAAARASYGPTAEQP